MTDRHTHISTERMQALLDGELSVQEAASVRLELEHGDIHVIEVELPHAFKRTRLRDLKMNLFAIIATVIRGTEVIIPDGNTVIQAGDHLMIFTSLSDEEAAKEHFTRLRMGPPTAPSAPSS